MSCQPAAKEADFGGGCAIYGCAIGGCAIGGGRGRVFPPQIGVDRARGALAVAHRQDHGRRAAHDVAAGEDARDAGHAGLVGHDVAPLVDLEVGCRRGQDRVRSGADRHDHHVAVDHELGALDRDGPPPAGVVRLAELHPLAAQAADPALLVAEHLERRDQEVEDDAFLLGVVDLLGARGELVVRAAVDDPRLRRAEPPRGPDRVHGHVAAADHDDALAMQDRRVGVGVPGAHQVDPGEVLVGAQHALQVLAGHVHEDRQPGADGDEDRVELFAQLGQGVGLADDGVRLDLDAVGDEAVDLGLDDGLRQAELRDAVDQHAAGGVERLEDRDVVADPGELAGRGEPGRARADDRDPLAGLRRPGVAELLGVVLRPVGDEALEVPDGDRLARLGAQADLLALGLLRADPPGHARQGVVVEERLGRRAQVAVAQERDEARDVDRDRAAVDAVLLGALQAALGFLPGDLEHVPEVDLAEVVRATLGVLLGHAVAHDRHPLLLAERGRAHRGGLVGHRAAPSAAGSLTAQGGGHRGNPAGFAPLERRLLERPIGRQPVGELAEVDRVGVEFGAVDAGVARLAVDRDAAAAAHPGAVDHDRVERHERRDAERASELADRPHHRDRTDRVDGVDPTGLQDVLEGLGDEAGAAVAAVVGAGHDLACRGELLLEDDPFARSAADDARHANATAIQLLGDRQDHGRPDPAADADGVAVLDQVGRATQRAGDVGDRVTGSKVDEVRGALADGLDDQGDRAGHRDRHRRSSAGCVRRPGPAGR